MGEAVWDNPGYTAMAAAVVIPAAIFLPMITLPALLAVGVGGTAVQGAYAGSNLYQGYQTNNHMMIQQGWQGMGATLVDGALTMLDVPEVSAAYKTMKAWKLNNPGKSYTWQTMTKAYADTKSTVDSARRSAQKQPTALFEKAPEAIAAVNREDMLAAMQDRPDLPTGFIETLNKMMALEKPDSLAYQQASKLLKGEKLTEPLAKDFILPEGPPDNLPPGTVVDYDGYLKESLKNPVQTVLLSDDSPLVAEAIQKAQALKADVAQKVLNKTITPPDFGLNDADVVDLKTAQGIMNMILDGETGLLRNYDKDAVTVSSGSALGSFFNQSAVPISMDELIANGGVGVCRHTAALFKKLADKVGLKCSLVPGKDHMWCELTLPSGVQVVIETTTGNFILKKGDQLGRFNHTSLSGSRVNTVIPVTKPDKFFQENLAKYMTPDGRTMYPVGKPWF
jgi:hypothetical protein